MLEGMARVERGREQQPGQNMAPRVPLGGTKSMLEPDGKKLCSKYGLPVPKFRVAKTLKGAVDSAQQIGYPVVLKIVSSKVSHKSDINGVILGLKGPTDLTQAYQKIIGILASNFPGAEFEGVLVEEMAPPGIEVIVGATRDPVFGPTIMFGLGGVLVEVLKDVSFRIAPLTELDATEMISEIAAYPVLRGYRNMPPADTAAIRDILMRASRMMVEHAEIAELDLNPVVVYSKGAKVVDVRIVTTSPKSTEASH